MGVDKTDLLIRRFFEALTETLEDFITNEAEPLAAWLRSHGHDPEPLAGGVADLLVKFVEGLADGVDAAANLRAARDRILEAARRN